MSVEALFEAAAANKIDTATFIDRLLAEELYVTIARDSALKENIQPVGYTREDDRFVVAFTRSEKVTGSQYDTSGTDLIRIGVREFLEGMPPDVGLSVNPGCEVGWEVTFDKFQEHMPTFGRRYLKQEVTPAWLETLNRQFAEAEMPPERRPWEAWKEWGRINEVATVASAHPVRMIFDWFRQHTKPGSLTMCTFFTSAYYYDASFWPVYVPLMYGEVEVVPIEEIEMPESVKARLRTDGQQHMAYARYWGDCYDYAYGTDDILRASTADAFSRDLVKAARDKVETAVSLALLKRPNIRAAEAAAFAIEMLGKAFLAVRDGLDETTAIRKYGHNVGKVLERCVAVAPNVGFELILSDLAALPDVSDRYKDIAAVPANLWRSIRAAISMGAIVMRQMTDRNITMALRS